MKTYEYELDDPPQTSIERAAEILAGCFLESTGGRRTVVDGLYVIGTGLERIADALETIAGCLEDREEAE